MKRRWKPKFETAPVEEVLKRATEVDGRRLREEARNTPTILVVDDERAIADTLGLILEGRGYQVVIAYGAKEALKLYDSRTSRPGTE